MSPHTCYTLVPDHDPSKSDCSQRGIVAGVAFCHEVRGHRTSHARKRGLTHNPYRRGEGRTSQDHPGSTFLACAKARREGLESNKMLPHQDGSSRTLTWLCEDKHRRAELRGQSLPAANYVCARSPTQSSRPVDTCAHIYVRWTDQEPNDTSEAEGLLESILALSSSLRQRSAFNR